MAFARRITLVFLALLFLGNGTAWTQTVPESSTSGASAAPNGGSNASANDQAAPAKPVVAVTKAAVPEELSQAVERYSSALATSEKTIARVQQRPEALEKERLEIEKTASDARKYAESLAPTLADVSAQLTKLGPPPGKDQPAEADSVAEERARLTKLRAAIDGAIKSLGLVDERARQLVSRIKDLRYAHFAHGLLQRVDGPLNPTFWRGLSSELPGVGHQIQYQAREWWNSAASHGLDVVFLLAAVLGIYFALSLPFRSAIRSYRSRLARNAESTGPAHATAFFITLARWAPLAAALLVLYAGLSAIDLLRFPFDGIANGVLKALVLIAVLRALARVVFSPKNASWRLVPLGDTTARIGLKLVGLLAVIVGLDVVATDISRTLYFALPISIAHTTFTAFAYGSVLCVLAYSMTPMRSVASDAEAGELVRTARWPFTSARLVLGGLGVAIVVLALTGFAAFADFLSAQVTLLGAIVASTLLFNSAIRSAASVDNGRVSPLSRALQAKLDLSVESSRRIAGAVAVLANLVLFLVAAPMLLMQWGISSTDMIGWARALLFGFEIGGIKVSPIRIIAALVLFLAIVSLTRLFQRWLRNRVLVAPRIDPGVANSIHTGIGYAGIALAVLIGISYAGFNITNLAIVAGALSVGIGFGLQSIVNNFVSGLILLVERPIKVGDWIVVGTEQGIVRRISVRATEIDTFDRASLIIPNSELITGRVMNWTHRSTLGRIVIKFGVAYDTDVDRLAPMLLEIANANELVLKQPAPRVSFDDFGASSLDFSLIVFIADIMKRLDVQTALRLAILKAFREQGIEIPFPQQDLHLRDLDGLKRMLSEAAAARAQTSNPAS